MEMIYHHPAFPDAAIIVDEYERGHGPADDYYISAVPETDVFILFAVAVCDDNPIVTVLAIRQHGTDRN